MTITIYLCIVAVVVCIIVDSVAMYTAYKGIKHNIEDPDEKVNVLQTAFFMYFVIIFFIFLGILIGLIKSL